MNIVLCSSGTELNVRFDSIDGEGFLVPLHDVGVSQTVCLPYSLISSDLEIPTLGWWMKSRRCSESK